MNKLALFVLLLFPLREAAALSSDLEISQFDHRAWTNVQLTPDSITSITQTADGWLWLSTGIGPVKFNGLEFDPMTSAGEQKLATASLATSDGGLWVGYRHGGVLRIQGEEVRSFAPGDGLPEGRVYGLAQDRAGVIWAATEAGIARYVKNRWETVSHWPFGHDEVFAVFVARDDTLWLATVDSVVAVDPNRDTGRKILDLPPTRAPKYFAQTLDGGIWLSAPKSGVMRVDGARKARQQWFREKTIGQLLVDRDGNLWMSGDALRRLPLTEAGFDFDAVEAQRRVEELTHREGLTGEFVAALFEDNLGCIWVSTNRGLDRFSNTGVIPLLLPAGMRTWGTLVMVEAGNGSVWIAASGGPSLLRYDHGRFADRIATPVMTAGSRAPDGSVWFGGPEGIGVIEENRLLLVPLPAGARGEDLLTMVHDQQGGLWASIQRRGLYRFAEGKWKLNGDLEMLPRSAALSSTRTPSGDLWFGFANNVLARISGGRTTLFTRDQGIRIGAITALASAAGSVWLGGESGLMRFDGNRFQTIKPLNCPLFLSIFGIHESLSGNLWLYRGSGLSLIEQIRDKLDSKASSQIVPCSHFGPLITRGTSQLLPASSSLLMGSDNRLWLAGNDGPKLVHTKYLEEDGSTPFTYSDARGKPLSSSVEIGGLNWNVKHGDNTLTQGRYMRRGRRIMENYGTDKEGNLRTKEWLLAPDEKLQLPPHTREISFRFAIAGIAGMNYRRYVWRLVGFSDSWKSGQIERNRGAEYYNLGPGHYRFEVKVDVGGSPGNSRPSILEFEILPAYYQTTWFRISCLLVALTALSLLFRLQLRKASVRIREKFEARMFERERIARDLHDTLLQGVQGLIMKVHAASAQMPERSPARNALDQALDDAQSVLIEGRDRVTALRDPREGGRELTNDIIGIGKRMAADHEIAFRADVHGDARPLHPLVQEEALLIVREALLNAFRHAQARHIGTDIHYDRNELRIVVSDDGKGLPQDVLDIGGRVGHWGMAGMHERADRIRGTLQMSRYVPHGTRIELRVRAAVAYQSKSTSWSWIFSRKPHQRDRPDLARHDG